MKKIIAAAAISLLSATTASAASAVGQCVFPQTNIAKNGHLEFKRPVYILSAPNASDSKQLLTTFSAFTVKAEANGYIQLATVPDYDKPDPDKYAGKIVGWAKLSDFRFQELRNCN
ncbi:hypothetical protein [Undibacterium sp.]|jgi:hypothetical protein|uniref:hypothetical protein n=1 Tax=Undibacterium sp. TaxID=1914977 RepID=UPI002B7A318F|nr:hypothetical protein [Undibacterium sp.]HTD06954.1 hypothetical protein [Undibacterium sp.]